MVDGRSTNRRELIVEVARRAFTAHGYDGTTIGAIAAELGISKAAVAYYFPAKDTFLDEFVTPFLDELERVVASAGSPEDAVAGYLDVLVRHHDVAVWMDRDPVLQGHPQHGARLDEVNRRMLRIVAGGSRRASDRVRALSTLGGVWRPVRELSAAELTSHHDAIVTAALAH